jgi:hypothetical protein
MTPHLVERRSRPRSPLAAAEWSAPATPPPPAACALGARVRMLIARALRNLATLLDRPEAPRALLPTAARPRPATCERGVRTRPCPVVAYAVDMSCVAAPEAPVAPSAPAEVPESLLEGPATEPSPLAHSVRPPEAAVGVGDLAAETLRSSGVAEVQSLMTLAPERRAAASTRIIATLAALEPSTGRARLVCNPRTSASRASNGPCAGAGR